MLQMKAFSKWSLLGCVALLGVFAVSAASAQAITITPANTAVSGEARNPELRYGGSTVRCNLGDATGTTSNPASARLSVRIRFFENCNAFGQPATVECRGEVTIEVTAVDGRGGGTGVVNLDANFACSVVIRGVCSVTIRGAQRGLRSGRYTPGTGGGDGRLEGRVTGITGREDAPGSIICPNEDRNAAFTADYRTRPGTITAT